MSLFISSVIGIQPSLLASINCPFLNIRIGSPSVPTDDQLLGWFLTVEPNLILLPHLPSYITSPSKGKRGCIFERSLNVLPKYISVEPSVTFLVLPAIVCW